MLDNWQLVRDRCWKLIVTDGRPSHVYDLIADPHELDNQVDIVENESIIKQLRDALTRQISVVERDHS